MNKLSKIFKPSDAIYCTEDAHRAVRLYRAGSGCTQVQFFAANPLDPTNWRERAINDQVTPRFSLNVTRFQNFIFESDSQALELQLPQWLKVAEQLPIALLTYSGGKSYHAVVSMQDMLPFKPHTDQGVRSYKAAWKAIKAEIEEISELRLDDSTKDPSRLTRMPGALRNGVEQKSVESVELERYITSEQVLNLMLKWPFNTYIAATCQVSDCIQDLSTFTEELNKNENKHLANKFKEPGLWAGPANMYPLLFQYTLWAIDRLNPSQDVLLTYLRAHTFPAILATGYPRDPELPVRAAYMHKGLS